MGLGPLVLAMVIPFRVIGSPPGLPDICHQIESTASAESLRGILRRGWACQPPRGGRLPAGSAMTSASARQARCINRAAEAWLHSARPQKSPAVKRGLLAYFPERDLPPGGAQHQRNRQRWGFFIGGKNPKKIKTGRAVFFLLWRL